MSLSKNRCAEIEKVIFFLHDKRKDLGFGPFSKERLREVERLDKDIQELVRVLERENHQPTRKANLYSKIRADYLC